MSFDIFRLNDGSDIRTVIPGVDDVAYFQTSGLGLKLQPALEAAHHWMDFQAAGPARPDIIKPTQAAFEAVRGKVACALGADADEIALTENATVGINVIAHGMAWQAGDQVILTDEEHPGNLIPWYNIANRYGVDIRFLPLAEQDDAEIINTLQAMLNERTRLIAISHVSRRSGRRLPARQLIDIAHTHNIPVMLDGAQSFGAIPVDVHALNCDFYVFSGHKYIMAPQGTGGLYVRRDRIDWLQPSWIGSHSQSWMDREGNMTLHDAAKRFEFGTRNQSDHIAFGVALDFWQKIGRDRVFNKIAAYTDELKERLRSVPTLLLLTPLAYEQSSGIVTFEIPGLKSTDISQHLLNACHVLVSTLESDSTRIRISTHVFNTEEEANRLVEGLRAMVRVVA